jgi:cellulose biosynthesis protein BcsQ
MVKIKEPKTIALWACTGYNNSELSFRIAKELSRHHRSLVVELPCLGIPRLGFVCNIMDRERHAEAAILDLDNGKGFNWDLVHKSDGLSLLPANVFAAPDYPVFSKVELNTLIEFPRMMISESAKKEYQWVVFDCQGQLTNPMTFFALKQSEKVVIPVDNPGDAAYVLANIKRLVNVFKQPSSKFLVLAAADLEDMKKLMVLKHEEQNREYSVKVAGRETKDILNFCAGTQIACLSTERNEAENEIFYEEQRVDDLAAAVKEEIRIQL